MPSGELLAVASLPTIAVMPPIEKLVYVRVVATTDGGSAFEDDVLSLTMTEIVAGVPPMSVGAMSSTAPVTYLRSDAFDSEPHPAPRCQWVVMLRGEIDVTTSDGECRRFGPGDLLMVTDTDGSGHTTSAAGRPPFEALFIPVS